MEKTNTSDNFTWLPFFNAMLKKICSEYDKKTLWEVFKKVYSDKFNDQHPILTKNPGEIDPFTFIAMLHANDSIEKKLKLCEIAKEELNLEETTPIDLEGILEYPPLMRFFYILHPSDLFHKTIDSLWELAQCIAENNEIPNEIGRKIDIAIEQINEKRLLSWGKMCKILFICFPDKYFPADTKLRDYSGIKSQLDNFEDFKNYQATLSNKYNEPPYIVSFKAINGIPNVFSYNLTKKEDRVITKTKPNNPNIPLNQILYGPPGTGKTYNTVIKAMEIINPGLIVQYKAEAITYDDVKKAFDEAKKNGQIEFVTFHQSYAYEEFVEGIKPAIDRWGEEEGDKAVKYIGKNGIFKEICKKAENPTIENQVETGIRENPNIWKVSLKGSGENPVRKDCMENDRIRIGWDEYGETIDEETDFKYGGKEVLSAFMDNMQIGDIVLSCYSAETIDAIGVITSQHGWDSSLSPEGYSRYRKVKWLVKGLKYNILKINNEKKLAPATVYQLNNISLRDILDIVKSNGQTINYKTDKPHVLIIDEINRGNISKIFGELITLIEPDKRQGESHAIEVKLPYSQDKFSVPKNLYIIGTMNTSDRSIATIDIALRRRFKFIEMMPDKNLVTDFGIGFKEIFEKLNTRIKLLLDRDHQIGHSYFINTKYENADAVTLKEIWFSEIIPLLNEYFYCDWEKLRRIIPGFLKQVSVPDDLKGECEDSIYEFKTMEEVSDLKAAFEQKDIKKDS